MYPTVVISKLALQQVKEFFLHLVLIVNWFILHPVWLNWRLGAMLGFLQSRMDERDLNLV